MSFFTALEFPTLTRGPQTALWGLDGHTFFHVSELGGTIQTLEGPAPRWMGQLEFPTLEGDDLALMRAFLSDLAGMAGRFRYGDPSGRTPRGTWSGTPVVNAGGQTGRTLNVRGANPSDANFAKAGDYIDWTLAASHQLVVVTEDAASDVSGNATLSISPAIRQSPTDALPLRTSGTEAVMMLANDQIGRWGLARPMRGRFALEFMEALPA